MKRRITIDKSPIPKLGRIAIHETEDYDSPVLWACNYDPTSERSKQMRDELIEQAIVRLGLQNDELLEDER